MSNKTTITVSDGVVTLSQAGMTIELTEGEIVIDQGNCGCDEPDGSVNCGSQPEWIRDEATTFGFIPAESLDSVKFSPSAEFGEATTAIPDGFWAIQNDGETGGIYCSFSVTGLAQYSINALTITVSSNEEGEDPIVIEATENGSGISGSAVGDWQLQAGKTYCVSVEASYSVE